MIVAHDIAMPTYPGRPINGGRLDLAPAKRGFWYAEPKYNGWRSVIHAKTGQMWNRHGERLTIASEFQAALTLLQSYPITWADCEALERRHKIGQGTLVILDNIHAGRYDERTIPLYEKMLPAAPYDPREWENNALYLTQSIPCEDPASPMRLWEKLKEFNRLCRVEFYEGIVMKKADSIYPFQLRGSKQETRDWIKHRWEF